MPSIKEELEEQLRATNRVMDWLKEQLKKYDDDLYKTRYERTIYIALINYLNNRIDNIEDLLNRKR